MVLVAIRLVSSKWGMVNGGTVDDDDLKTVNASRNQMVIGNPVGKGEHDEYHHTT